MKIAKLSQTRVQVNWQVGSSILCGLMAAAFWLGILSACWPRVGASGQGLPLSALVEVLLHSALHTCFP